MTDQDTLDQSEVDKLLFNAVADSAGAVYNFDGQKLDSPDSVKVDPYNFRAPTHLSEGVMRHLNSHYERFCRYLAARLSLFFRMEFRLALTELRTQPYSEILELFKPPSVLNSFSIDTLKGLGLINYGTRIGLTMVNRMLGGKALSAAEDRALTEIEMGMMDEATQIFLSEWCAMFPERPFHPEIVGRDNDARFIQITSPDAQVLSVEFEAEIGDCTDVLTLVLPFSVIQPILDEIQEQVQSSVESDDKPAPRPAQWMHSYSEIEVPVFASWHVQDRPVADILRLKEGDILQLPKDMITDTKINIMNTPCFQGEVGIDQDQVAVRINSKLSLK